MSQKTGLLSVNKMLPSRSARGITLFARAGSGKGFFVSQNNSFRSEQLRKTLAVFSILFFTVNLAWSWPFSKSRSTDNAQPATEQQPQQPDVIAALADPKSEVKAPARPVAAEVTVLEVVRTEDPLTNVTRSVSVIDQDDIKNSTARSVPELLKSGAGIVVSKTFDNPKGTSVDIRGFGETSRQNVLVLVDGRRANQIDFTGADWSAIPLSMVERVEVIRGPSTVIYGDNATGGVINIVTKKTKKGIHAKAETEAGLHKYKRNGGTVSAANDWARGLFHFENTQDGGWRTNSDYWANDWFGKVGIGPWHGGGIDMSIGHHRDRYGMPGALFMSDIESLGRKGSTHSQDRGWTSETFVTANPYWDFDIGEDGFSVSAFNSFRRRQSKGSSPYPASLWSPAGDWETVHQIDSYEFQPKITWTRALNDWITSKTTGGFDVFFAEDRIRSGNRAPGQDVLNIVKKSLGMYLLENLSFWERFLLNVGVRGDWAKYRFDQKEAIANLDTGSIRNAAFDIGPGFRYNERSLAYLNVSRAYRMPATDEFYTNMWSAWGLVGGGLNAGLKQQQQMNYELGVRDNTWKPLDFALNVFLTDVKDEIYYDPNTFNNQNYSSMTRRYGLEMESALRLFEKKWYNVKPFLNLTTQKPYFKGGDYANKEIPFVPGFKMATGFVLEPVEGLTLSAELNHLGSRFAISDQSNNQAKMKSYTTVDLKARYRWKWATAWVALTNIFDSKFPEYAAYSTTRGEVGYYPAQGFGLTSGFSLEY
jgi:iron complex outermembrane receptor protein